MKKSHTSKINIYRIHCEQQMHSFDKYVVLKIKAKYKKHNYDINHS